MLRFLRFGLVLVLLQFFAQTVAAQCDTVTNMAFTEIQTNSVRVTWTAATGATTYAVSAWKTGVPGVILYNSTGPSTTRVVTNLPAGEHITVEVRGGTNAGWCSEAALGGVQTNIIIITETITYSEQPSTGGIIGQNATWYLCLPLQKPGTGHYNEQDSYFKFFEPESSQNPNPTGWAQTLIWATGAPEAGLAFDPLTAYSNNQGVHWATFQESGALDAVNLIDVDEPNRRYLRIHSAFLPDAYAVYGMQIELTAFEELEIEYDLPNGASFSQTPCYTPTTERAGITLSTTGRDLLASPNPFTGRLELRVPLTVDSPVDVTICNALGQRIAQQRTDRMSPDADGTLRFTLATEDFAPGTYFLTVETAEGRYTRAVVKQ